MPDEITAAAQEILDKIKHPLDDEDRAIVNRTMSRLLALGVQGMSAPADQLPLIKSEALTLKSTLLNISDEVAVEALTLIQQKFEEVATNLLGKALAFV